MPRPSTLRDVAAKAGVSKAAASAVLAGRGREARIGEATAERVRAAAAELGWRPNATARTLARGRTDLIGIAADVPLSHRSLAAMLAGMEQAARRHGQHLHLLSDPDQATQRGFDALAERRIDALVLVNLDGEAPDGAAVVHAGAQPHPRLPSAHLDPAPGLAEAVRHLAGLGHRRIRWFGPQETWAASAAAVRLDALRVQALPVDAVTVPVGGHSQADLAADLDAMTAAVAPHLADATACVCYNDLLALAVLRALRAAGRQVPRDASVVGFDDLFAVFGDPPLATVSHCLAELGAAAIELALARREGQAAANVCLPARWIPRASVGPART
jgi:LacI family transcriptional regulator